MERRWKNKDNENVQKIQWHPAFVAATKIEFEDEREKLKFESEYQLSKKPMQIDLLILKKVENDRIHDLMSVYLHNRKNPLYRSVMKTVAGANKEKLKEVVGMQTLEDIWVEIGWDKVSQELKEKAVEKIIELEFEKEKQRISIEKREKLEVGEEKINALNRRLIGTGRIDDLIRTTLDYEYQKELIMEMEEKGVI